MPVRCLVNTQREKKSGRYFTNLTIELVLFHLAREAELFDWSWIDARRNGKLDVDELLRLAPHAWRDWVNNGYSAIERCRRNVARNTVVKAGEQSSLTLIEKKVLDEVFAYYVDRKHPFEGLASYIATRIIGHGCKRGWVTKRSGDMGIDFVCRLDVGDPGGQLSRTPLVVLGQAKCQRSPISAPDLARVVARLQRGWMGAYVTTGVFSEAAQLELAEDKYPLVLINGKRLAQELERATVAEGLTSRNCWVGKRCGTRLMNGALRPTEFLMIRFLVQKSISLVRVPHRWSSSCSPRLRISDSTRVSSLDD